MNEEEKTYAVSSPNQSLHELQAGSFEVFYRLHHDAVYRPLAMSLRDASLAAEATDEAFARAYERWETVREYENPPGWVYRVALNWSRSKLRRRRFETVGEYADGESHAGNGFDPDLDLALSRLPLDERAMVILKHYAGWTYDEIAEALGIRPGTVKSRLHRIMTDLRAALEVRS